jgi:secondary thiamine-phosphate synthase enzyme
MPVSTRELRLHSSGNVHTIDVTEQAEGFLADSGLSDGVLVAYCPQSTSSVVATEFEPGLLEDLTHLLERLATASDGYRHNQRCRTNDGHAHMRSLLTGASLSIPFVGGRLLLDPGRQLVLIDYSPQGGQCRLLLQLIGE